MCELLLFVCFLSVLFFLNCSKLSVLTWFFSYNIVTKMKSFSWCEVRSWTSNCTEKPSQPIEWVTEKRWRNKMRMCDHDRLRRFSFQVDGREDVLLCYVFLHLRFFLAFSSCFTSLSLFLLPLKNGFVDFLFRCCFAPSYSNVEFFLCFFLSLFLCVGDRFALVCLVYHNRMSMDHRI